MRDDGEDVGVGSMDTSVYLVYKQLPGGGREGGREGGRSMHEENA